MERQNLGVNAAFADAPGDDLGVLGAEIENDDLRTMKSFAAAHWRKKDYGRKAGNNEEVDTFRHRYEADSTICLTLRCAREEDRKLFQPLCFSKPTVRGSFRWLWRMERLPGSHLIRVELFPSTHFMCL